MDFGDGEVDTIENCEIFTKGHGIIIGHDYQGGSINLIENCTSRILIGTLTPSLC